MIVEVKVPAVGESITEATIAEWVKNSGDYVERDDILLTLETDKASVEVVAEQAGVITTKIEEGETIDVGTTIAEIDTDAKGAGATAPATAAKPPPAAAGTLPTAPTSNGADMGHVMSPAAQKIAAEKNLSAKDISGTGKDGRITKADAVSASAPTTSKQQAAPPKAPPLPQVAAASGETQTREKMTVLRRKIAERLVQAQHNAAILTTFNEVDMTALMALRAEYKDSFKEKHGLSLGFMGFFVKAAVEALKDFPRVNAFIEGDELILNHQHHVGIAVGTPKGLVVPVVKNVGALTLAQVEQSIRHYALKARDGKIAIDDMSGGTFTISNGGVYGSLMSTPILNAPQSAILGMHKIEERPIALNGEVVIRPMMYLALSYDHRVIDGEQSVKFLVRIKECIENPTRILLEI